MMPYPGQTLESYLGLGQPEPEMPDDATIARLARMGFEVEDMEQYGSEWEGQFRWMRYDHQGKNIDFGSPEDSEAACWAKLARTFESRLRCPGSDGWLLQ